MASEEPKIPFMDRMPTVISCCFCCFLRAGTVMIAVFSFVIGLVFAPNVSQSPGFWDMDPVLSNYSTFTEAAVQMILGIMSIMLCAFSVLLLIGACCNAPRLILMYQWGAIFYCVVVMLLLFVLALFCFFVHENCILAGVALTALIVVVILFTAYFVMVANSLRLSLLFLNSTDLLTAAA